MKELLKRLENMTPEEYENFQPEGLAVARAISSNDYVQDNSFEINFCPMCGRKLGGRMTELMKRYEAEVVV